MSQQFERRFSWSLMTHALNRCRVRRAPAARVRGTANPARWVSLHSVQPLHSEKPGADFGFLLALVVALGSACSGSGCSGAGSGSSAPATAPADEDGYDLWLRYPKIADKARLAEYRAASAALVVLGSSPTLDAARAELERGLTGLLGAAPAASAALDTDGSIVLGTLDASPGLAAQPFAEALALRGDEAFAVHAIELDGRRVIAVAGNTDRGVLYGAFALLRHFTRHAPLAELDTDSAPSIARRVLNHWDNLDRTVERGYAGSSLWDWAAMPGGDLTRYIDYARANASLGINGSVLTNVNANAQVLTPAYLERVRALADVFRPYGIAVYLTARFSAPIEIGGLTTADPLAPEVAAWWIAKADEIYALIPDFGGFLVKANSEGQPGPREYGRTHAEGANLLADAVGPHGGVVMWRAFVYSDAVPTDRIRQAYDEFEPLDASFRDNVLIQVKNGPLDFQPREPFHPLFGAMPETPIALELQITKEYLGQDTHLAYLGPLFEEVLDADTFAEGPGSTVARVVDGSLNDHALSAIAGVANIGSDRNWTGSPLNAANWYVYGRLAWDPELSSRQIAEEWVRQTFSNEPAVVAPVTELLMSSRETLVDYMTPLGLTHIMASGHHYGPGPWVNDLGRADWNPVYYHRADPSGIGFDRTATGSNALAQYFPPVRDAYASRASVPDNLLLFFHRVGWNEPMRSGRSLWDELVFRYDAGVAGARRLGETWAGVRGWIDERRFDEVAALLRIQADEARWWRDAALAYFGRVSGLPLPAGVQPPAHPLDFYQGLACPVDRTKPRCEPVYTAGSAL
jgi:alpha-glucuronidase